MVQLSGTGKKVWVQPRDLSNGVIAAFNSNTPLGKNAQARVNRAYYEKQQEHFAKNKESAVAETSSPSGLNPVKWGKRAAKWIGIAQLYVQAINKIMQLKATSRPAAREEMFKELQPCKQLRVLLTTERFLEGFVVCKAKNPVIQTCDKVGFLRCTICKKNYKWAACERVCKHVVSLTHHRQLKKAQAAKLNGPSRQILHEACETAAGPCTCTCSMCNN